MTSKYNAIEGSVRILADRVLQVIPDTLKYPVRYFPYTTFYGIILTSHPGLTI
jgi:hypothetical protein